MITNIIASANLFARAILFLRQMPIYAKNSIAFILKMNIMLVKILSPTLPTMAKTPTKAEILEAIIGAYYSDLDFIEAVNNMTYARKVQLKANPPNQQNDNEPRKQ